MLFNYLKYFLEAVSFQYATCQKILQNPQGLNLTGLDTDLSLLSFFILWYLHILLIFSLLPAILSSKKKAGKSACGKMAGWVFAKERSVAEWFAKSPDKQRGPASGSH